MLLNQCASHPVRHLLQDGSLGTMENVLAPDLLNSSIDVLNVTSMPELLYTGS